MNDDLNLLITFVSKSRTIDKVVLHVPHGMNTFKEYEYFGEDDIWQKYEQLLPLHVTEFIDFVVSVEEIYEIVKMKG